MRRLAILTVLFTLAITSCESIKPEPKPVLKVEPESLSFYVDGTGQLTTNAEDAVFSSEEEFFATVDEAGMVTAKKVGNTIINVDSSIGSAKIPVSIIPKYDLYPDLDKLVGAGQSQIIATLGSNYSTGKTLNGQTKWTYKTPTSYCLEIIMSFSGSVVDYIMAVVSTSYTKMITSYLLERYAVAGTLNDAYYFYNYNKSVMLMLQVYSAYEIEVIYGKYPEDTKSGIAEAFGKSIGVL